MTEHPEFLGTFGRNVVCIKCHGKLSNPDTPSYDDLDNAIFTCSSCGGMYRDILDITTPNKPEKVNFRKPKTNNEKESFTDAKQAYIISRENPEEVKAQMQERLKTIEEEGKKLSQADKLLIYFFDIGQV